MTSVSKVGPDARGDCGEFRRQVPIGRNWASLEHVNPLSGSVSDTPLGCTWDSADNGGTPWSA